MDRPLPGLPDQEGPPDHRGLLSRAAADRSHRHVEGCELATNRDVARLAGVSPITVSCVLNDHANVSATTREQVKKASTNSPTSPTRSGPALAASGPGRSPLDGEARLVAAQPAYELGQQATELLLQRLAGAGPAEAQEIVLPIEVIVRVSSAPPRHLRGGSQGSHPGQQ